MKRIKPQEINDNFIKLIGTDWMLVTSGNMQKFNTMTASWGCVGFLWNLPVVFVFIRPQRYTFEFIEKGDMLTLSFFGEEYRKALQVCGSRSGRNTNKVMDAGLTPLATSNGNVTFEGAKLVLECRKLYADMMRPENFTDLTMPDKYYPDKDFHKIYALQIVEAWIE